jgi:hypothetical protein
MRLRILAFGNTCPQRVLNAISLAGKAISKITLPQKYYRAGALQ